MLNRKQKMQFVNSRHEPDVGKIKVAFVSPPTSLLMIRSNGDKTAFHPAFGYNFKDGQLPTLAFSKWWDGRIFHPATEISLSRKNIIFSARTQDGGAHVDDHLTDLNYRILRTIGQANVMLSIGGQTSEPPGNLVWPIIRQIAWELDQSLMASGF